jgi:hypothetical protein
LRSNRGNFSIIPCCISPSPFDKGGLRGIFMGIHGVIEKLPHPNLLPREKGLDKHVGMTRFSGHSAYRYLCTPVLVKLEISE